MRLHCLFTHGHLVFVFHFSVLYSVFLEYEDFMGPKRILRVTYVNKHGTRFDWKH